ncbi:MAG: recombination protein NinG [Ignavibacteriales bacterium]|nr:recombination protein NinG [Ignavibacteriales bacterium]
MNIKIDPADKIFSQYIRLRDKVCVRCNSQVRLNAQGLPVSHQASHYFGRGQESTRFDSQNVDCLCTSCHVLWGSRDREDYRFFKIKQLGQVGFDALLVRSKTIMKKDRKLALIKAKALLSEIIKQKEK